MDRLLEHGEQDRATRIAQNKKKLAEVEVTAAAAGLNAAIQRFRRNRKRRIAPQPSQPFHFKLRSRSCCVPRQPSPAASDSASKADYSSHNTDSGSNYSSDSYNTTDMNSEHDEEQQSDTGAAGAAARTPESPKEALTPISSLTQCLREKEVDTGTPHLRSMARRMLAGGIRQGLVEKGAWVFDCICLI